MKTFFYNTNPVIFDEDPSFDSFISMDGNIAFTGLKEDLERRLDGRDKRVDLGGNTIIPGMTDSHLHLMAYAATKEKRVNLRDVDSLQALQERVREYIELKKWGPDDWICGSGWNHDTFPDRKMPDRHDLDAISTDRPIMLVRMCFHACAANTKALRLASITADTPDPEGGYIDRDSCGNPTGILRENAVALLEKAIPALVDKAEMKELILSGCKDLVGYGFTTAHVDDFGFAGNHKTLLEAYLELDEAGMLPLDLVLQMLVEEEEQLEFYLNSGIKPGARLNNLYIGPIKILGDGSLGSRTAALKEPYSDTPGNSGFMLFSYEELDRIIRRVLTEGFNLAVHAIGDLTMETVAGLLKKYRQLIKDQRLNPSVIHCTVSNNSIMKLFREEKITANIQPIFLHSDWQIAEGRIGAARLKTSYCWKQFHEAGILCAGSSDAPVEGLNPFYNIYAAVARKDLNDQPDQGWMPQEALSREEALRLFTINPPALTGESSSKGRLKTGYRADFAVLSAHPYSGSSIDLKNISALETYKDGVQVY